MKTGFYLAVLMGLTALPITAAAEDKFRPTPFVKRSLWFWLHGREHRADDFVEKRTQRHQKFRANHVRQRRAHRFGLDALGGRQYPRQRVRAA